MQLPSKLLLSLLVDPDPSPFMSPKYPSQSTFLALVNQLRSVQPRSLLTVLTTVLCLACARVAYRYTQRKKPSTRNSHGPPLALRKRRRPSISEITVANTSPAAVKEIKLSCIAGCGTVISYTKRALWDCFLCPLLAWLINTLAVIFAVLVSFIPSFFWVKRKKLKVCVATSLPSSSDLRHHKIQHAETTQFNKGKTTPTLSPYFSALMVPAALSCTRSRKSLVLDLDETLVHSQFKLTEHCDLRLEVRVDEFPAVFYVSKRPYLDVFLRTVAQWYDVVIYTASLQKYGDPLITVLDTDRLVKRRIFRQDCIRRNGNFVKDLTIVNPNLADVLIVDNSPAAYSIQPSNAVPIEAWYHDQNDEELLNLLPLLHAIAFLNDVRSLLDLRLTGGALAGRRGRPVSR
ncbi:unnamed protein product [Chondrus crispus]|uniref:FCP1 homology domain-containing protein n=1 Tax=Chondrus crispus TaxID=2769 RepID=R7QF67_CHOCR|nr:unnamed protein product [Chondrus crispus]CDF36081.1 unnamed protein product [Chondrus crispus]|eukprot:XP_005715900.1 unnamed protein product [Chondrus crispus]